MRNFENMVDALNCEQYTIFNFTKSQLVCVRKKVVEQTVVEKAKENMF